METLHAQASLWFDRSVLSCELVWPGVTTDEIDAAVHKYLISQGSYPAAVNFFGFPKSICASVNEGKRAAVP